LSAQIATGQVKMFPRAEMLDLVIADGHPRAVALSAVVADDAVADALADGALILRVG
jgi:hypothetical protein